MVMVGRGGGGGDGGWRGGGDGGGGALFQGICLESIEIS